MTTMDEFLRGLAVAFVTVGLFAAFGAGIGGCQDRTHGPPVLLREHLDLLEAQANLVEAARIGAPSDAVERFHEAAKILCDRLRRGPR